MEKLIELLNEYEFKVADTYNYAEREATEYDLERLSERIISKKYGFIKWLVDNDKIDRDKIIEKSDFMPIVSDKFGDFLQPTEEQELLMLLSIQENPIEFLCSVIK